MMRLLHMRCIACLTACLVTGLLSADRLWATEADSGTAASIAPPARQLLQEYCLDCHSSDDPTAGLDLATLLGQATPGDAAAWERIVRKLRTRQMPPADMPRPEEPMYQQAVTSLEEVLDARAAQNPQPGRTSTFRRLTRFEYQNAIRDLLGVHIDASSLLPADEVSHGFDNITVEELSPTLLNRYISAAQLISRLAIARPPASPDGKTFRIPADVTQEEHVPGLPLGTRGGLLVETTFPADGLYEIRVRLTRDRNEQVEGLSEPHQLEVLLDGEHVESFVVQPVRGKPANASDEYSKPTHENVDRHLVCRVPIAAGVHRLGVTFVKNPSSLLETERQPLNVHFNMYRHPRLGPAVYQVSVTGPLEPVSLSLERGQVHSRDKVFRVYPASPEQELECARQIIADLLRRACRAPVTDEDVARPLKLYEQARAGGSFEDGIELALGSILVHPRFLFRIEQQPADVQPQTAYRVSDLELATRLSFFLWSSLPDEQLLTLAEQNRLRQPGVLEQETRRMLADPRSTALVSNFAGQWLYLRNLDAATPDMRAFPDFDDNLRQAFRRETELCFEHLIRENRSLLELLSADYTFLNERLAKHYGVPHVYGSHFRKVALDEDSQRGGLLRQGSVLTVTSYATRTSPVLRGKWILENILGTPPPPPPPDVPALTDNVISASLSVRERLAQHRADPACAGCHQLIDPPGFALENFDAVGRWRELEEGRPVDATGGLPDGRQVVGVAELERGLLERPELFVATVSEKLLTYALGRGTAYYDAPAIRQVVATAAEDDYRLAAVILAIVRSVPFQMRTSQ